MSKKLLLCLLFSLSISSFAEQKLISAQEFFTLVNKSAQDDPAFLHKLDQNWQEEYNSLIIEIYQFIGLPETRNKLNQILSKHNKHQVGKDLISGWRQWFWETQRKMHPEYPKFKASVFANMDRRFPEYFRKTDNATINLSEILWGGVLRDGIPPLKDPKLISAKEAIYLADTDIIFAIENNGDARAYPKRIMAWHEMFKDKIGGEKICGVYCTLCGSMIAYYANHEGTHYELGTSGFLYRSNKLMYDHKTKSMWSTLKGEPVVGPLVGKGIKLKRTFIVTTTWGEWRKKHPKTKVLSLDTGHKRDYGEGVAYNDYFSSHRLMFPIVDRLEDKRLKNKEEVFAMRFDQHLGKEFAVSASYMKKNRLHTDQIADIKFIILADPSGACRAYQITNQQFTYKNEKLLDSNQQEWQITESALISPNDIKLKRLPSHRAFWFAWHATFPKTKLVK